MPENLYFQEPTAQQMMLDILFVFCKLNQDVGYRQGMHELLAPVLWVIQQDSIDPESLKNTESTPSERGILEEILDFRYIEHDSFTLFSLIMHTAKSFYELNSDAQSGSGQETSPIVEKSKRIHEQYLNSVDPELAEHLKEIEVLPQVFLM
jgi:TBC1 domain family protein 5